MDILIESERALEVLINRMNRATASAERAIDETLEFVDASNRRIARMEAQAQDQKAKARTHRFPPE